MQMDYRYEYTYEMIGFWTFKRVLFLGIKVQLEMEKDNCLYLAWRTRGKVCFEQHNIWHSMFKTELILRVTIYTELIVFSRKSYDSNNLYVEVSCLVSTFRVRLADFFHSHQSQSFFGWILNYLSFSLDFPTPLFQFFLRIFFRYIPISFAFNIYLKCLSCCITKL